MDEQDKSEEYYDLSVIETIKSFLIGEFQNIIYDHKGSAYSKFILIAVGIEYLGACLDERPFEEDGRSETRFNDALKKLFDKGYEKHAKADAKVYLYRDFRCPMIHQFRPSKRIILTKREDTQKEGSKHLEEFKNDALVLVLEDLFDDFEEACKKFIAQHEKGKFTNKKGDKSFLAILKDKLDK